MEMPRAADRFSICVKCAIDPVLKSFIAASAKTNRRCSLCRKWGNKRCSSQDTPDLENVFKALIRIHFNEWDYNGHWGGHDSPTALLATENEIIDASRIVVDEFGMSPGLELLDLELARCPYPDFDKGIGIYAGYGEDCRPNMLLEAIKDRDASSLQQLKRDLQTVNASELEASFQKEIKSLAQPCSAKVSLGETFYRARIGFERTEHVNSDSFYATPRFVPYANDDLGAPPPPLASAGRLNRQGVSYLYVATCAETAISEVRPHPGHFVSVGKFKCKRSLRVLDFSKPTFLDFPLTDVGLRCFDLVTSIERDLSMPITPEQRAAYISAQFIAELIRQRGFDGVIYRSSVSKGTNLCTFSPSNMAFVPSSATVFRTKAVLYEHEELPIPS